MFFQEGAGIDILNFSVIPIVIALTAEIPLTGYKRDLIIYP